MAIDFRVDEPRQGVGMSVRALARGLSNLHHPDQEYIFVVYDHSVDWLATYIGDNCSVVGVPSPSPSVAGAARNFAKRIPGIRPLWRLVLGSRAALPVSDGTVERLGCDVVHFPSQTAYRTELPSIYQPWDLQHLHLREYFSRTEIAIRELLYRGFCARASCVCVSTEWGKRDLMEQYGTAEEKIAVVRMGTPLVAECALSVEEVDEVRRELNLPASFLLYPAITWPHKNHENLLRGLALFKQQTGASTHLCLTGAPTSRDRELCRLASSLGVGSEVHFLGFVSARQLRGLYQVATAMVFPSRFEGLGLPVLEAFEAGVPLACSEATVLPEVAGDAALYFDPQAPAEIATTMATLVGSKETRERLVARGRERLRLYSPDAAAAHVCRLYEHVAGRAAVNPALQDGTHFG